MTPALVTTQVVYDAIKSLIGKESAYAVAKFLGASSVTAGSWRHGKTTMDDPFAIKAAEALGWDVDVVLASLAAERADRAAKPDTAAAWHRIAVRLSTAAAVVFAVGFSLYHSASALV